MAKNQPDTKIYPKNNISPSFVKLAMRNMVRKGNQSISHFGFTALAFIAFILILAWLGKPNIPH
tara:strand:+ start:602 stop:793 length:192 start_codon:yes stop_codon:yes gene_type:complete